MKHVRPLLFAVAIATLGTSGASSAADSVTPRAVVELYTSQGCNACPPADQVLFELNQEHSDLLLLSFHVEYWNYLGWTDPFSDASFSARQRDYANRMRERYVYTPQVVINGNLVVRATAKQRIESASRDIAPLRDLATIRLNADPPDQPASGTISFHETPESGSPASESPVIDPGTGFQLWLVGFDRKHQRDVLSGENAGKTLTHANVVREMVSLGVWDGRNKEIPFALTMPCDGGVAVLVQHGNGGPVVGASMVRF